MSPFRIFLVSLALLCSAASLAGPVNINKADAATLSQELIGIGPTKAKAIVAYRKQHGAFRAAEELTAVKGIGESTVSKNRANIKLK